MLLESVLLLIIIQQGWVNQFSLLSVFVITPFFSTQHIIILVDYIIDFNISQQYFTICNFGMMSQSALRISTGTDVTTLDTS